MRGYVPFLKKRNKTVAEKGMGHTAFAKQYFCGTYGKDIGSIQKTI